MPSLVAALAGPDNRTRVNPSRGWERLSVDVVRRLHPAKRGYSRWGPCRATSE